MDERKKKDEKEIQGSSFIHQIDQLQFPKRGTQRRTVYIDEKISVVLVAGRHRITAEIVDISPLGLALVIPSSESSAIPMRGDVALKFSRENDHNYEVQATISNLSKMFLRDVQYVRVGLQYKLQTYPSIEGFMEATGGNSVSCRSFVRPQISAKDPFFYNEIILFQTVSFTPEGVILVASARCKTILPNQILDLDFSSISLNLDL